MPDGYFTMGWSTLEAENILHSEEHSAAAARGLTMSWDEALEYTIEAATEVIAQAAIGAD
jgi:hypothetical protein